MWSDNLADQSMGLQSGSAKRKLPDTCISSVKLPRNEWSEDPYGGLPNLPIRAYQYQSPVEYSRYQAQQTICCDNGKSYLDLGSFSGTSSKCCQGRTAYCSHNPTSYRQKRLTVLNISMCKLSRYRQFSDPSLHKSVLICNTLRLIEREMEQEGYFNSVPAPEPIRTPEVSDPPRSFTPFPSNSTESDSGFGDERTINWGSVLSLSNQSDLDPINNNDSNENDDFTEDPEDVFPTWKLSNDFSSESLFSRNSEEVDSLMHVLVNT